MINLEDNSRTVEEQEEWYLTQTLLGSCIRSLAIQTNENNTQEDFERQWQLFTKLDEYYTEHPDEFSIDDVLNKLSNYYGAYTEDFLILAEPTKPELYQPLVVPFFETEWKEITIIPLAMDGKQHGFMANESLIKSLSCLTEEEE